MMVIMSYPIACEKLLRPLPPTWKTEEKEKQRLKSFNKNLIHFRLLFARAVK